MAKIVDTKAYLDMICDLLKAGETASIPVSGSSMTPFLHNGDTVFLQAPEKPLKKGDIVLYTRPTGQYVLHRIVRRRADGSFLVAGDAQTALEQIHGACIRGVVTQVQHKGQHLTPESKRWRYCAMVWGTLPPLCRKLLNLMIRRKHKSR